MALRVKALRERLPLLKGEGEVVLREDLGKGVTGKRRRADMRL